MSEEKRRGGNAIRGVCAFVFGAFSSGRGAAIKTELSEGVWGAFLFPCSCFAIASPRITNLKSLEEREREREKARG